MNGRPQIARAGVVAIALAALAVPASQALAESFHVRPTIKMKRVAGQDRLSGRVHSQARACEQGRKIKLLHRPVDQKERWSVLAKLRTNGKGKWTYLARRNVNGNRYATPGNYHVKVGETTVSAGGREILCKEKFSSSMLVG